MWCVMLLQIGFLLFILLYVFSYIILCTFKRRADNDDFYAGTLSFYILLDKARCYRMWTIFVKFLASAIITDIYSVLY